VYDYRGTRDRIFGIVREPGSEKMKEVIETTASITQRVLLLALVEFAPNIEPSTATLARMLGTDPRSVRRLLRSCEQKGLLKVTLRKSASNLHATNHYEILCDPGLKVPTGAESVRTVSPNPTDCASGGVRVVSPPKRTSKADKEADSCAPHSRTQKKAPEKQPEGTTEARDHYVVEFERTRGAKPEFGSAWGRAVIAFGGMVAVHGLVDTKQVITRALEQSATPTFTPLIEPWDIAKRANSLKGNAPQTAYARRGARMPPQNTGVNVFEGVEAI
jgi:hypothetical protein